MSAAEYQKTVFKSENDIFVRFFHTYTPTSEPASLYILDQTFRFSGRMLGVEFALCVAGGLQ